MTTTKVNNKALVLLIILLIISLTLLIKIESLAFSGMKVLGVTVPQQSQSNWCWAASSVGILDYYGTSVSQSSFVTYVKGSAVNDPASDAEAQDGLDNWGISSTLSTSNISYNSLVSNIADNNDPVYVGWSWTSGGGHVVVVKGILNYDFGYIEDVYYMNPADGLTYRSSYAWLSSGSGHVWDGTLHNFN